MNSRMGAVMFKYIMALLFLTSLALGYATYSLTGKLAVARQEVTHWTEMADKAAKETLRVSDSCKLTIKAVQDAMREIDALSESRTGDLEALAVLPQITLPETKVNATKKPTATPTGSADGERLSPDLMRLLDNAYCSGSKDDPYCTAR